MMLKRSSYNVEIKRLENGDILLFNSLTLAFGIMDIQTQEIYFNIENIKPDNIKLDNINLENINPQNTDLENTDEKIKNSIDIMKNNGFLIESTINEFDYIKVLEKTSRYNKGILKLTIAPTLNCNMACPYCYEGKLNKKMDEETINSMIRFVENYIIENRITAFATLWYGGEPLLEKDTIYNLSRRFIDLCKTNNISYTSNIVTNGVLLDYITAKTLKEECMVRSAQITIDGLREVHNKRRILIDGQDSFGKIISNIDDAKDVLDIIIRVNVDKTNVDQTEKLIEYFIDEKKWNEKVKFYFAPVNNLSETCNNKVTACFVPEEFGYIDGDLLRKIYIKGIFSTIEALYPKVLFFSCGAIASNEFVVDPDGFLYKCWNQVGIKEQSVGNLAHGEILNNENVKWLSLELPKKCETCNVLPICQGGCPLVRLKNNNASACGYKTISFKENLLITYEQHAKSNEKSA
jgi:uncharacterized protein